MIGQRLRRLFSLLRHDARTYRVVSLCIFCLAFYFLAFPFVSRYAANSIPVLSSIALSSKPGRWWQPTAGLTRGFAAVYRLEFEEATRWNRLSVPLFLGLLAEIFFRPLVVVFTAWSPGRTGLLMAIDVIAHLLAGVILLLVFFCYGCGWLELHAWPQ